MLSASGAFASMVEGVSQTIDASVTITLPTGVADVSLSMVSIEIDASTTTDMPDDTRIAAGYPATQATIVLAGTVAGMSAADYFNGYNSASPMYRKTALYAPVTVKLGVVPSGSGGVSELLTKLVGMVDDYTVDYAAGTVTFTCIDKRGVLRTISDIPAVITAAPYNAGLTAEFAVDALLRSATNGAISSWPAQRPSCVLAAGMRSSLFPEVGGFNFATNLSTIPFLGPQFAEGKFGSAIAGIVGDSADFLVVSYTLAKAMSLSIPTVTMEFVAWDAGTGSLPGVTVSDDPYGQSYNDAFQMSVNALGGYVDVAVYGAGGYADSWTTPYPTDGMPHYVGVSITWAAGTNSWSATVRVDGVTTSSGTRSVGTNRSVAALDYATFVLASDRGGSVEALQISTESAPTWNDAFTPQALIQPSLNSLQVVPEITGDPWQTIQQIADAEQAVAGFDDGGVFRFTNRNTLRSSAPVRTITATTSLVQAQMESSAASLVDRVQIPCQAWSFSTRALVWSADSVYSIPPRSSITVTVVPDDLVTGIDRSWSTLPNGGGAVGSSYYRASVDAAGTAAATVSFIGVAQQSSNKIVLTLTNNTAARVYLVSPASYTDMTPGTPVLQVGGLNVTPGDAVTVDHQWPPINPDGSGGDTTGAIGIEVVFAAPDNPWIQDPASAGRLCSDLLADLCQPRPMLRNVAIVPDPRLQLMDRVIITDPITTKINDHAVIWGYTLTLSADDYSMTVDARAVGSPGGWLLGVAGRTELAQTTYC